VIELIGTVLPLAAFYQLLDGMNSICGGVFRGCGHQKAGALINLTGFYLIGIPIGLVAAFKFEWGLLGLWAGISIGLLVQSAFELAWISRIDWAHEAVIAKERLAAESARQSRTDPEQGLVGETTSLLRNTCPDYGALQEEETI
jgi:MATE family multidrug resistance protein